MKSDVKIAAILAGGSSRRMGHDKALVKVGGVMMLERAVRAAIAVALQAAVVGRARRPAEWPADLSAVVFLRDDGEAFGGPVGGVITALKMAKKAVLILGCDMPLVSAALLSDLIAAHARMPEGKFGTMAVSRDARGNVFGEPALAIYTTGILPRLEQMVRTGNKSFQVLLKEKLVWPWEVPAEMAGELLNANDAATLAEAERIISARATVE
jgi:molybdopterin-guanine dinucleotide biosynthesis protein A